MIKIYGNKIEHQPKNKFFFIVIKIYGNKISYFKLRKRNFFIVNI
jgi:hypothetical protein